MCLHIPGDIQHQLEIVILGHTRAGIEIAQLVGQSAAALHEILVVRHCRRVDDKIGTLQRDGTIGGFLKREVGAKVFGITLA